MMKSDSAARTLRQGLLPQATEDLEVRLRGNRRLSERRQRTTTEYFLSFISFSNGLKYLDIQFVVQGGRNPR